MSKPTDKEILDFAKKNLVFSKNKNGKLNLADVNCDIEGDVASVSGDVVSVSGDVGYVSGDVGTVCGKIKQGE